MSPVWMGQVTQKITAGNAGAFIMANQPTPLATLPSPEIAGVPYDQGWLRIAFP